MNWYMCTTWNEGIKQIDVAKELPKTLILANGRRISRKYNQSVFVGRTKEEAKANYISKLIADLDMKMRRVEILKERIEEVKTW